MRKPIVPVIFLFLLLGGLLAHAAWFGVEDCPSHWIVTTGYADACRFQAPEDGTSSWLEIRTWGPGGSKATFRMAVYDNDNGHPGVKLWEGKDIAYQSDQWCGEDISGIQLIQDIYFWFAFKTGDSEEMCYVPNGPPGSHEWKAGQAYADTFPNPWGSCTGCNSHRYTMRMHYISPKGSRGIIEVDAGVIEGGFIR